MEIDYKYNATVTRVVDGDTLDVIIDLGFHIDIHERVRLEGIDTPETYGVKKDSPEYMKGIESKQYIQNRLAMNDMECKIQTTKTEKYGRWLATIWLADTFKTLNEELVERGLAKYVNY